MKISKSSGKYEILDSGTVLLQDMNAELTFCFEERGYQFRLVLRFAEDNSGRQDIGQEALTGKTILTFHNFRASGTGTGKPVEFATFNGKPMSLLLWSYAEGDALQAGQIRGIKYTIYLET